MADASATRTTGGSALSALVVIPTYEEAANVPLVLRRVRQAVPDAHVLIVDDNSPDGTAQVAEDVGRELGRVEVLRRPGKSGLGSAYRAGFAFGLSHGYDVVVEMDADLSHNPDVLPELLRAVADGADLAIGSRYVPGGSTPDWPLHRRAVSRFGNRYAALVLGIRVRDATAGFRAFRSETLEQAGYAATRANGYAFQIELAYQVARQCGVIVEVPIVFDQRTHGRSKMSTRIAVEAIALVTWWGLRDRVLRRPSDRRRVAPAGG